jgi:hypothetical protein
MLLLNCHGADDARDPPDALLALLRGFPELSG